MGVIMRNGNAYGDTMPIDGKENQVLVSDGKQWTKPSQFKTIGNKDAELRAELNKGQIGVKISAIGTSADEEEEIEVGSITARNIGSLNVSDNSNASFTNKTRFTMTDQSIADIGHNTMMHIYDNVYIDIDGPYNPEYITENTVGSDDKYASSSKTILFNTMGDYGSGNLGEVNPWTGKKHNVESGPTILIHGNPYMTISNSYFGAPNIQFGGIGHFLVSDNLEGQGGPSPRWSNTMRKSSTLEIKPTVFGTGFSCGYEGINYGPIVHFTGSPTIEVTESPFFKLSKYGVIAVQEHGAVYVSDNAILEMGNNGDLRVRDDANIDVSGQCMFKMHGSGAIELFKDTEDNKKNQIYLSTGSSFNIDYSKESQFWRAVDLRNKSPREQLELFKAYANSIGKNHIDNEAKLLVQGKVDISLGSDSAYDIVKFGTQNSGAGSCWNITPRGNTYVKFGGETDSNFVADITPDRESETLIKFGANKYGNMQIYVTGSIFKQMSGISHHEMHNASQSIMRGLLIGKATPWNDNTNTERILSAGQNIPKTDEERKALGELREPYEQACPSPLHAMYDAPTFVMRGTWKDTYENEEDKPEGWTGRAEAFGDNPLFEMIERSKIIAEGTGSIVIDSDGITINGIKFTNERLKELAG